MRINQNFIISVIFLAAITAAQVALAQSNGQPTNPEINDQARRVITHTLYLPVVFGQNKIFLCENKIFDGYTTSPFMLQTEKDTDPKIKKIIRNCTFRNSTQAAIIINDAQNVLIENNTFENIRTNQAGKDVHAINIRCRPDCHIDNVMIKGNSFESIGADGIQLGTEGRNITNMTIDNNIFQGSESVGENAIDIKGVNGPVYVRANRLSGFRDCQAGQDCSGSNGAALVIHTGFPSGKPTRVIIRNNSFYNNNYGLIINNAGNITIKNNDIFDNQLIGLLIINSNNVTTADNTFWGNPKNIEVNGCKNCSIK